MNLLYLHGEPYPSQKAGARFALKSCLGLAQEGARVSLLMPVAQREEAERLIEESHPNLLIRPLPSFSLTRGPLRLSWNRPFHLLALWQALKEGKDQPLDAILCRNLKLASFFLNFKDIFKTLFIYEAHKSYYCDSKVSAIDEKNNASHHFDLYQRLERKVMSKAHGLIVLCHAFEKVIQEEFPFPRDICVAPSGIELEGPPFSQPEGDMVCYVGQLHPHKGLEVLLQAMTFLPSHARLMVIGGDDGLERLKRMARSLGIMERVTFTGFIPHEEVKQHLLKAKVAVAPFLDCPYNRYLTSPMKLFEYMAFKVPVVASKLPAMAEIIKDEETGLLVQPGDVVALSHALMRLLNDPSLHQRLREKAYASLDAYTWRQRAKRIISYVERLKKEARPRIEA